MQTDLLGASGSGAWKDDSLFERCWWLYAMCREHLFTDHTQEITDAIAPLLETGQLHHVLEVGCGPGFYSRRLATLFPHLQTTGIDTSEPLLSRAREQARRSRLQNCRFLKGNALSLGDFPDHVDAVIASRLFLILANRDLALNAIFLTLRPGGLCFIAEPTSRLRAAAPLWCMQMLGRRGAPEPSESEYPLRCRIFSHPQFQHFIGTQPWASVRMWQDKRYQYALCEKAA